MENKKSDKARLEPQRPLWFLLALVVVMATFYVAINYTSTSQTDYDEQPIDDLVQDINLMPAINRDDRIAVMPTAAPAKPTPTKINVVDEVKQEAEKLNTLNQLRTNDGTADDGAEGTKGNNEEASQAQPPVAVDANDNPLNLRVVEQLPEFPGGMVAMMKWITKTLRYPPQAQQKKIQGKVVVTFIINKDGMISNIKIAQSADPLLNNEALRVVRLMPTWKPGLENNKPCRTMFAIPIEFKL